MNDSNSGYPWSSGDTLTAADLNAAIANAGAIAIGQAGRRISAGTYSVVPDFETISGTVSWNGATVTITGRNFTIADVGKYLLMPAGGAGGAPQIVQITGGNGSATVNPPVTVAFAGLDTVIGGPASNPWSIDVNSPGVGGSLVGDILAIVSAAPAIRPATVQVIQTKVASASIVPTATFTASIAVNVITGDTEMVVTAALPGSLFVGGSVTGPGVAAGTLIRAQTVVPTVGTDSHGNPIAGPTGGVGTYTVSVSQTVASASLTASYGGQGGPVGRVLLRGTTGYGRRVVVAGNVNAGGSLDPLVTDSLDPNFELASSLGGDPGAYWLDVNETNGEAFAANPRKVTLPGHWANSGTVITLSDTVSPLVMPVVHPGATVFAVADDGSVAFPTGTKVVSTDAVAMTVTVSQPATSHGAGSGQINFTDNRQDVTFAATFANGATTVTATAALPAGVRIGQTIFGPGLTGSDDPTTPLSNTVITNISGTTVTISRPTTQAAVTAVTLHAVPYLTGVVLKLNLVPAVLAYKDWGAYAGVPVPVNPLTGFGVTGGGNPGITLALAHQGVGVSCGTDNTAQINAWLAAARSNLAAGGQGMEAMLPPGAYLALGGINARDLNQPFTLNVSGVSIHSAAKDLRAWDASGSRYYRMVGDFVVRGDQLFPPDIGLLFAYSTAHNNTSSVSLTDVGANGFFKFAATYLANTELYTVSNMDSSNAMPWTVTDPPAEHPNDKRILTPSFGKVIDGDNSWGRLDLPAPQTHASFLGFVEDVGNATCNGGAIPYSIIGCSNYVARNGYGASWSAPSIFFSKSGHAKLDIHSEVETLTDGMFFWARSSNVVTFGNSTYEDASLGATNSAISYDVLGKFGVPIRALSAPNSKVMISWPSPLAFHAQVFDDHSAFTGALDWHGDISVSGAAKTASVHWLANLPDDREGSLLLGDDKTNFSGDFISGGTITSGGIISAGDDISTTAWVNAEDGIRIGPVGFPRANLTFDGTQINSTVPLSLPIGSIAVTPPPGDNDTSIATTAFVQAAASGAVAAAGTISAQTIATVTANTVSVPAGTNYVVVSDSVNAVNTLTVGSGTLADGYDLWMNFPNGGVFAGQTINARGNLTLKTLGAGWSILAKFG